MVRLIEVDVVGAQPPQRGLDGIEEVLSRQPAISPPRAHGAEAFRGHDELVPPSIEPAAEDLFGAADGLQAAALRVNVGGVEERDTAGGGFVQNRAGGGLVTL